MAAPRLQTAHGLDRIFSPKAVAVIGASPEPGKIGHKIIKNILDHGYTGAVYPIHPTAHEILGRRAFRTVLDVPAAVDLAVVAVPAGAVLDVAQECGRKGVGGLVVVSAGFREAGPAGEERESRLRGILKQYGMRMVGPNCLGIVNADPEVSLHATFAPRTILPGATALMTQSGAMGIALIEQATRTHLGLSRFVSLGNKTDVSGNDLLLLWENDPGVKQILLYLESIGNPRNFLRIATRVGRKKPIVLLKSGRSMQGARAAGSHTGALADDDALVDALADQCGILRVQSVAELFDVALALDRLPLPAGPRVGIVTNSGGPAIMAVDALVAAGLEPAKLAAATQEKLKAILPAEASVANPVDLLAGAGPESFRRAVSIVAADPGVDALLVIGTSIAEDDADMAGAFADACKATKPTAAVIFGRTAQDPGFDQLLASGAASYTFPEDAVHALAALRRLALHRNNVSEEPPAVEADRAVVARCLARPGIDGWLSQGDAFAVFAAYGIPVLRHAVVQTAQEAADAAGRLGFPVAVKLEVPGIVHKSEVGALRLGVRDPDELVDAIEVMRASLATRHRQASGIVVMEMAKPGVELLLGGVDHARYGPTVAVGLGGVFTEVMKDVVFRFAPVGPAEAKRMLGHLRGHVILQGARGQPPVDEAKVVDSIVRFSALLADFPAIAEAEINPMRAGPWGCAAVDARLRVAQQPNTKP